MLRVRATLVAVVPAAALSIAAPPTAAKELKPKFGDIGRKTIGDV